MRRPRASLAEKCSERKLRFSRFHNNDWYSGNQHSAAELPKLHLNAVVGHAYETEIASGR